MKRSFALLLVYGPCADADREAAPTHATSSSTAEEPWFEKGSVTAPGCEPSVLPLYPQSPPPSPRDVETKRFITHWVKDRLAPCPSGTRVMMSETSREIARDLDAEPLRSDFSFHVYEPPYLFYPNTFGPAQHEQYDREAVQLCVDDAQNGYYRAFTYERHIIEAGSLEAGQLDGYAIRFQDNKPIPVFEAFFRDGEANGSVRRYRPDGSLRTWDEYRANELHGSTTDWYENGMLDAQLGFSNGEFIGVYLGWYPDGTLKSYAGYLAGGSQHLDRYEYEVTGQLRLREGYCRGKWHGVHEYRDEQGNVVSRELYIQSKLVEDWEYRIGEPPEEPPSEQKDR